MKSITVHIRLLFCVGVNSECLVLLLRHRWIVNVFTTLLHNKMRWRKNAGRLFTVMDSMSPRRFLCMEMNGNIIPETADGMHNNIRNTWHGLNGYLCCKQCWMVT